MDRQQFFQGETPKRPRLSRPLPTAVQGNQPQVGHGSSNNPELQGYIPRYYNYNNPSHSSNNNVAALPPNNVINSYGAPMMFPQAQLSPTLPMPTSTQPAPAQLVPEPSFQLQHTEYNTITQGGSPVTGNIFPSHSAHTSNQQFQMNITAQGQQDASRDYSFTQLSEQLYTSQQPWTSHQSHPAGNNTVRLPFARNAPQPQQAWNIPRQAPFPIPESYGTEPYRPAIGRKRAATEDAVGVDMVQLGRPKRRKVSKPRSKTKAASTAVRGTKNTPIPIPKAMTTSTPVPETRTTPIPIPDSKATPTFVSNIQGAPTPGPEPALDFAPTPDTETITTPSLSSEVEAIIRILDFEPTSYPEPEKSPYPTPTTEKPLGPSSEVEVQPAGIGLETEARCPGAYDHLDYNLGAIKDFITYDEKHQAEEARQQKEKEEELACISQVTAQWAAGDPSQYPAECYENLRLPGCEYRAQAICVGTPSFEWFLKQDEVYAGGPLVIYAMARLDGDGVEFKLVKPGSSIKEVMESAEVQFSDIWLDENFSDMSEKQITRWTRYLLAAVPGVNDTITMWTRAGEI
ncbi:hypothetical protein GGR55DRAFT_701782 [Xylaria sp. FL0064]|nr:hypothetical protein GGR55DRAFT_701782 [Xylaria sp. FL0064]